MNYFISDTHFGHAKVLQYDKRPFSGIDEMDEMMIERWNQTVSVKDDVYVLGDFAYRNKKSEEWYLKQLKGRLHLIVGNHDGKLLTNKNALDLFVSIDVMKTICEDGKWLHLCHYPLADWNKKHYGGYHIHGHIHNAKSDAFRFLQNQEKALNAGCMINDYAPVTLEELIENNRKYKEVHY